MKKITLLLSFIACVMVAQAQLLLNENFDLTVGALIGQNSWAIVGTTTTSPIMVSAATPITYAGYPSSGIGGEVAIVTTGQDVTRAFTAQLTGTIYYSFLVNITTAKSTYRGDYFIHVVETGSTSALFSRVFVKQVGSKLAFGILNASGGTYSPTFTAADYDLNTTYLIVVKLNAATAASSLIINPTINTEPTTNWIENTTGGTSVPLATKGIGGINIRQGTDSIAPTLKLDGIHVATTWANLFASTGIFNTTADILKVKLAGKILTVTNSPSNSVEIFNALGAKVKTLELVNGSVVLDLTKGIYVVRAGQKTAKIMM